MLLARRCRGDLFLIVLFEAHHPRAREIKLFGVYLGYFYLKAHTASGDEDAIHPDHSPDITPLSQDPSGIEFSSRFLLVFYIFHFVEVYEELSGLVVERNFCVKRRRRVMNGGLLSVLNLLFDVKTVPYLLKVRWLEVITS